MHSLLQYKGEIYIYIYIYGISNEKSGYYEI